MYRFTLLLNYLNYYITASGRHSMHSPYLFNLVNKVLYDNTPYPTFQMAEALRAEMLKNNTSIAITDFGAGSSGKKEITIHKTISRVARSAAKPPKYARLLFRLAAFTQPKIMIELGTSLGLSACYQAAAVPFAQLFTCEGSTELAAVASSNFDKMKLKNIEIVTGNFDDTFTPLLSRFETIDWVFFDGNHSKVPTLRYFKAALEKVNKHTVFIFDDINWSEEMKAAWQEIKQNEQVVVTIDVFMMGIVLFNNDLSRQHFVMRY